MMQGGVGARLAIRLRRHTVWSTAIYVAERLSLPLDGRLVRLFRPPNLFRRPLAAHTRADPFLVIADDTLFLLLEIVRGDRPGVIEAWSTRDLERWHHHGVVLRRPTHLSYPHPLLIDGEIHLMPESKQAGGVMLYRFDAFPHGARPIRTVLHGAFNDPTPFHHDGIWYVFATSAAGLELFWTPDLRAGPLHRHPAGVIEPDARRARCGGAIVRIGDRLYRPAQDGRQRYGGSLDLREIVTLTPTAYAERAAAADILSTDPVWARGGGHHLSSVTFRGKTVYAVDGQAHDPLFHKLTVRIAMAIDRLRGRRGAIPAA